MERKTVIGFTILKVVKYGWSVAMRPTNGETVPSLVVGSAQAPPNNHWNGRTK
jgi:hypothetical protein